MYTPNNIRFRIVSSNAIAQYKMDQAFDFNELVNNPDYTFSQESRETLLLNYELWFRFIIRLERILIRNENATVAIGTLGEHFSLLARDIAAEIEEVIQSHPALFMSHSKMLVKRAFDPFLKWIFHTLKSAKDDNMYVAFPKIVTTISSALHNMLFILQEMEDLKTCSAAEGIHDECPHFLSYTNESIIVKKELDICPTFLRAQLYKSEFGVDGFYVKNYTDQEILKACGDCVNRAYCEDGLKVIGIVTYEDPLDAQHEHQG